MLQKLFSLYQRTILPYSLSVQSMFKKVYIVPVRIQLSCVRPAEIYKVPLQLFLQRE